MGWVRGPDVDYDDWAKRTGDDWWKWDNVLGYLKRVS
jgi:choline dehydrogenase-like flavoprotein